MAKTNPIGVRFDEDMLRVFKEDGIADSPQKSLNFLSAFYLRNKHHENGGIKISELFRNVNSESHNEVPVQIASTTPPRNKIETPKEVVVKEMTPVNPDDLVERFKGIKMFIIEDFSNYPMKNKPNNINELTEWLKAKKIDDQRIRGIWQDFLKTKK